MNDGHKTDSGEFESQVEQQDVSENGAVQREYKLAITTCDAAGIREIREKTGTAPNLENLFALAERSVRLSASPTTFLGGLYEGKEGKLSEVYHDLKEEHMSRATTGDGRTYHHS